MHYLSCVCSLCLGVWQTLWLQNDTRRDPERPNKHQTLCTVGQQHGQLLEYNTMKAAAPLGLPSCRTAPKLTRQRGTRRQKGAEETQIELRKTERQLCSRRWWNLTSVDIRVSVQWLLVAMTAERWALIENKNRTGQATKTQLFSLSSSVSELWQQKSKSYRRSKIKWWERVHKRTAVSPPQGLRFHLSISDCSGCKSQSWIDLCKLSPWVWGAQSATGAGLSEGHPGLVLVRETGEQQQVSPQQEDKHPVIKVYWEKSCGLLSGRKMWVFLPSFETVLLVPGCIFRFATKSLPSTHYPFVNIPFLSLITTDLLLELWVFRARYLFISDTFLLCIIFFRTGNTAGCLSLLYWNKEHKTKAGAIWIQSINNYSNANEQTIKVKLQLCEESVLHASEIE